MSPPEALSHSAERTHPELNGQGSVAKQANVVGIAEMNDHPDSGPPLLGHFISGNELQRRQVAALGKYCRSSPLVFSFVPRCQGEWGSQKKISSVH